MPGYGMGASSTHKMNNATGSTSFQVGYAPPPPPEKKEEEEFLAGEAVHGDTGSDFMAQVQQEVRSVVGQWAKNAGYSTNAGQALVNQYWPQFVQYAGQALGSFARYGAGHMDTFQVVVNMALDFMGARLPFSIQPTGGSGSRGSGRGRGSTGPRPPTPDEIRAQFDLDALAEKVNDLSRLYLITDHKDPRKVASAYVEAIVKTRGEQKIEFETFVRNQLKKDPRWSVIMQNKPEGMDEAQYIQRYAQQVMSFLGGGDEAQQIAFEQAALGSSAAAVQERLQRTRAFRSSSEFVNRFEEQIRGVSELLR